MDASHSIPISISVNIGDNGGMTPRQGSAYSLKPLRVTSSKVMIIFKSEFDLRRVNFVGNLSTVVHRRMVLVDHICSAYIARVV